MPKKGGKRTAKEIKAFLDASYDENPPEKIDDWVLDKDLTTDTAKVYYRPSTGEAVVAHRGTKGALDWFNNAAYAAGYYELTPRYWSGRSVQNKAEKKYGKQNISTLGHSQGAVLSRKLGADTKEVINVNPAYMGEIPKKNEYNIRSSTDVVSGLYSPVASTREFLYPEYSKKHDITIPSQSATDILGEHSKTILERLDEDTEIGVGAENNISSNNIMKAGRRTKELGFEADDIDWIGGGQGTPYVNKGTNPIGVIGGAVDIEKEKERNKKERERRTREATTDRELLEQTAIIQEALLQEQRRRAQLREQQFRDLIAGPPLLTGLNEPVNLFVEPIDMSVDEDDDEDLPQLQGPAAPIIAPGTPPATVGVFGNEVGQGQFFIPTTEQEIEQRRQREREEDRLRREEELRDPARRRNPRTQQDVRDFAEAERREREERRTGRGRKKSSWGRAFEKGFQNLAKGTQYLNPVMWALGNKGASEKMRQSGDLTYNYLLPATVSAGKPIYDASAMIGSTMLTGNPLLGKVAGDTLWEEMVGKRGFDPRERQKSKELGFISKAIGEKASKPFSASLTGGIGKRKGETDEEFALRRSIYNQSIRNRRATDPEFRERRNAYEPNRRQNDPEFREKRNAYNRNKRATDPEYRERLNAYQPNRRRNDPEYRERLNAYNRNRRLQQKEKRLLEELEGEVFSAFGDEPNFTEEEINFLQETFPEGSGRKKKGGKKKGGSVDINKSKEAAEKEAKRRSEEALVRVPDIPVFQDQEEEDFAWFDFPVVGINEMVIAGLDDEDDEEETGAGRKKKNIDFEKLRWGTFERMFHDFKRENPKARVKDLEAFAKRIIKNKSKFSEKAFKKANFYLNVIKGKKTGGGGTISSALNELDSMFQGQEDYTPTEEDMQLIRDYEELYNKYSREIPSIRNISEANDLLYRVGQEAVERSFDEPVAIDLLTKLQQRLVLPEDRITMNPDPRKQTLREIRELGFDKSLNLQERAFKQLPRNQQIGYLAMLKETRVPQGKFRKLLKPQRLTKEEKEYLNSVEGIDID